MSAPPEDVELVRAAQAGDVAALGRLLERRRALLVAVATGLLGRGPQVDDAVQDTCLIALRRIADLRRPEAVRAWLLVILRNRCREHGRARSLDLSADLAEAPSTRSGPEEAIERSAVRDWVWTALAGLSEPLRLVVVLRYFTGVTSYDDIAEVCGVPVGTVRSRLSSARAKLVDELLATAAGSHADADDDLGPAMTIGAAMTAFERTGDRRVLDDVLAPDVRFALADRVPHRGRDRYAAAIAADFDDGVSVEPIRALGGRGISVLEARLVSPREQPLHCPPALTMVHLHDGRRSRQILTHYAAGPDPTVP